MNGSYLLDTNIVIALLTGEGTVVQRIDATDQFYISSIVMGELFYGAFNSMNVQQNVNRINDFVGDVVTVPCDNATARVYGEIKASRRRKGRPLPDNDIWIAATAKQHLLSLVSRDDHFAAIEDLPLVRW
jgi:tRNA(fMet)-specific endonuclease VapC